MDKRTLMFPALVLLLSAFPAGAQEPGPIELANYRAQWTQLADVYDELAVRPSSRYLVEEMTRRIEQMTDDDLALLMAAGADLSPLLQTTADLRDLVGDPPDKVDWRAYAKSPGFPDAQYSVVCGSTRSDTDAGFAAKVALQAAKGVWSAASRACEQVAVAAGVGGNTSLACIAADTALFVAEAVLEDIDFCDGSIDSAELAASYQRLGHLHGDLDQVQADLTTDLRQTIENNLKLGNPSQMLVSLQIPAAFGGQLEQVALVVQESMDNMLAAGQSINFSQTYFDQAETLRSNGSFKQAYLMYRRAYQEVARLP